MTKQQLSFKKLFIIALAAGSVILSLAKFSNTNNNINNQMGLYDAYSTKSQFNNEKAHEFNPLNNDVNQFLIQEFKNIYRVKA